MLGVALLLSSSRSGYVSLPAVPDRKESLQVLAEAHTNCVAIGGDAAYDGGCALAKTYSSAYAAACAEAFAASFVDFAYGKKGSCECDIAVSVLVSSISHEFEIISAFYETEVEARSCTPDVAGTPDYAYIKQTCWANSMADMVARVRASCIVRCRVQAEWLCARICWHRAFSCACEMLVAFGSCGCAALMPCSAPRGYSS